MLEFSVLTSILQAYRKVIILKHETILKNNLLENYILKIIFHLFYCEITDMNV